MNRSDIKKFATWARKHLLEQMTAKATLYGITESAIATPEYVAGGMVLNGQTYNAETTNLYKALRKDLDKELRANVDQTTVVQQLIDDMAYTWFNRLAAMRFMEVNGYIERVLSSSEQADTDVLLDPDILRNASSLIAAGEFGSTTLSDLENWRSEGDGVTYQHLLNAQSKELATPLPQLFEARAYAALFTPSNLLTQDSLVRKFVTDVAEEDWQDIEIIGWLYQFYISDRKDEVIGAKKAVKAEDIPAATQLFTPRWIVQYMVENSVGRLWLESHPESNLKEHMPYYLESEQVDDKTIDVQTPTNKIENPQDLTVLDPACGSGHILVYAFDLLYHIYQEQGYADRDIPALICEHNLFGLDIDDRAIQLASFALLMKARSKNRAILRKPPQVNLLAIASTRSLVLPDVPELNKEDWQPLVDAFVDADNLGSLITPPEFDVDNLQGQLEAFENSGRSEVVELQNLQDLLIQSTYLKQQYKSVVANPPYMGSGSFNKSVKAFVHKTYKAGKQDLYGVYILRNFELVSDAGIVAMITIPNWMFLSSFEDLRKKLIETSFIETMSHNGRGVWGSDFGSVAFTIRRSQNKNALGIYKRLFDKHVNVATNEEIEKRFFKRKPHTAKSSDFEKIPGSPIAYWVSEKVLEAFEQSTSLGWITELKKGLSSGQNDRFFRYWYEPDFTRLGLNQEDRKTAQLSGKIWFPINKGGEFRRWYGNHEWVVNWFNDGETLVAMQPKSVIRAKDYYFKPHASWSKVTSGSFVLRYFPKGFIISDAGSAIYSQEEGFLQTVTGLLNSTVTGPIMADFAPTLNFEIGQVSATPILNDWQSQLKIASKKSAECINLSIKDWNDFESSWDFESHPLIQDKKPSLEKTFDDWSKKSNEAFYKLKQLEEENNHYWIEAYSLKDELTPEVPEDQITIRRADKERDIKSLLSYAVGCMMGRYSLDREGLCFAGGTFNMSDFTSDFLPDDDGIIPITDEAYFEDDISLRFVNFLKVAYSEEHLEENLNFVADALGRKSNETARGTIRRYFLTDFIKDHIKIYSKRPIYWLFNSGKKKGFSALVYLHRYTPDTLAKMRTGYVLEMQSKLASEIERYTSEEEAATSATAKKQAQRKLKTLGEQELEVRDFHDKLQHKADERIAIDLDDGVAYNYTLFEGLVYEGSDLKMKDLYKKSQWKRDLLAEQTKDTDGANAS